MKTTAAHQQDPGPASASCRRGSRSCRAATVSRMPSQPAAARLTLAQDTHADEVLSAGPVRPARGDAAGPAVPDGARVPWSGQDPRTASARSTSGSIAEADPEAFAAMASTPPAIHRYGRSMAGRVQTLARVVVEEYDGDACADLDDGGGLDARAHRSPQGAARLRGPEGADLRRAARQAARRSAPGLARGHRPLCRGRLPPVGRRRGRRRLARQGERLQAAGQGGGPGQLVTGARNAVARAAG